MPYRFARILLATLSLFFCSGIAVAVEPAAPSVEPAPQPPATLGATIERGLGFLVKDALAWKGEHACASCHHASMMVWAMREAKLEGHTVDEPVLAELTQWVAESGDGKTGIPRPENVPKAIYQKAVWYALALEADPAPDNVSQEGITRLLTTVKEDQTENGSWSHWPETRPPIFSHSDENATVMASLALQPAAVAGDEAARAARDRGIEWLLANSSDHDPQSVAMRLVLWRKAGRPTAEWQPLVELIKQRQNADGGWSQSADMASDAWATGQALYALAHADLTAEDPAIARGQAFLIATQREDGSWPMTSRPTKPGDTGSPGLVPITGGGSAWGVLGLVRSGR